MTYGGLAKRMVDLVLACTLAVVTLPVQLVLAVLIRRRLGSPVVFTQERPGRQGKPFRLWKFRTMTDARDAAGELLPDEDRLPPFGAMLRSTSLDELPELYNVIRGDMSMVGPRPLLMKYLPLFTQRQARRHEVRPGVTGWAQVNGRNRTSWPEKLEQDVWYVDNVSPRLDLTILWRTVRLVLRRDGIHPEGHPTAPEFTGSQ